MPKFYRQNKKRIDPRYFLSETTDRDLDEGFGYGEHMSSEEALKRLESDLLTMADRPDQLDDNQNKIVDTLLKQLDKFKCGRVKVDMSVPDLPPQEIKRLSKLSANKDMDTFFRIAADLVGSRTVSAKDTDNDGIPDEKELAIVDKGELNETMLKENDEKDVLADAEKLYNAGGDWRKVKSTFQDAYINGQITDYGKRVEDKYHDIYGSFANTIKRKIKNLFGINRTNRKMKDAADSSGAYTSKRGVGKS